MPLGKGFRSVNLSKVKTDIGQLKKAIDAVDANDKADAKKKPKTAKKKPGKLISPK
jgi:hypothetical protein